MREESLCCHLFLFHWREESETGFWVGVKPKVSLYKTRLEECLPSSCPNPLFSDITSFQKEYWGVEPAQPSRRKEKPKRMTQRHPPKKPLIKSLCSDSYHHQQNKKVNQDRKLRQLIDLEGFIETIALTFMLTSYILRHGNKWRTHQQMNEKRKCSHSHGILLSHLKERRLQRDSVVENMSNMYKAMNLISGTSWFQIIGTDGADNTF